MSYNDSEGRRKSGYLRGRQGYVSHITRAVSPNTEKPSNQEIEAIRVRLLKRLRAYQTHLSRTEEDDDVTVRKCALTDALIDLLSNNRFYEVFFNACNEQQTQNINRAMHEKIDDMLVLATKWAKRRTGDIEELQKWLNETKRSTTTIASLV